MVYMYSLSSLILAGSAASSAFVPLPHNLITKPCHVLNPNNNILLLEEKKNGSDGGSSIINLDTFISSLPSPEDLKENILEVSSIYLEHIISHHRSFFVLIMKSYPH